MHIKHLATILILLSLSLPALAAPSFDKTWTDPITNMKFVWIESGCYHMGSNSGLSNEMPEHRVCVDGFWMGKYEVTIHEYRIFLKETDKN